MITKLKHILIKDRLYLLLMFLIITINLPSIIHYATITVSNNQIDQGLVDQEKKELAHERFEREGLEKQKKIKEYIENHPVERNILFLFLLVLTSFFGLGVYFNISGFIHKRFSHNPRFLPVVISKGKWLLSDVVRVIILVAVFGYVAVICGSLLSRLFFVGGSDNISMLLGSTILDLIAVSILLVFIKRKYGQGSSALGINFQTFFKNVWVGLRGYITMMPWLVFCLLATSLILSLAKYIPPEQPVFKLYMEEEKTAILAYTTFFAAMWGPIFEEIFFRGFLFSALRRRYSLIKSGLISSAFFSFLHFTPAGFLPILILGYLFAYLYEKTGSLVAPIAVHMAHNTAMVMVVLWVKRVLG